MRRALFTLSLFALACVGIAYGLGHIVFDAALGGGFSSIATVDIGAIALSAAILAYTKEEVVDIVEAFQKSAPGEMPTEKELEILDTADLIKELSLQEPSLTHTCGVILMLEYISRLKGDGTVDGHEVKASDILRVKDALSCWEGMESLKDEPQPRLLAKLDKLDRLRCDQIWPYPLQLVK
jgi:hypothetical protein